jgi:hypothetical protein
MSTEPVGGTISGNSSDINTVTDRQLFDHAVNSPDPTPAPSSPPSSEPSSPPSSGASSDQPASTRPDLQQQNSRQSRKGSRHSRITAYRCAS